MRTSTRLQWVISIVNKTGGARCPDCEAMIHADMQNQMCSIFPFYLSVSLVQVLALQHDRPATVTQIRYGAFNKI